MGKRIRDDIIALLQEEGALPRSEIEERLGFKDLYGSIARLKQEGKIQVFKIPRGLTSFPYRNLYYTDEELLMEWLHDNLSFPAYYRVLVSMGKASKSYSSINLRDEVYNRLKEIAEEKNMSVREMAEEKILESMEVTLHG